MSFLNKKHWSFLEQWSPALFYIAGGGLILVSLQNLIGFAIPYLTFLGPICSILAIIGLISLYPKLSIQTPTISIAGISFLLVSAISIASISIINPLIKLYPNQSFIPNSIFTFFHYGQLLAIFLGFLLFGIAALRSNFYSKILGYLLLIPALLVAAEFLIVVQQAQGDIIKWFFIIALGIQALDYLVVGFVIYRQNEKANAKIDSFYSKIKEVV